MQLVIHNRETDKYYWPAVQDDVTWELNRKGTPGKLIFKVLKDSILNFNEGNTVRMSYDGKQLFFGYVFIKKRNKDSSISVTAYDQLRYLKNKDVYSYTDLKASQVITNLAKDFRLTIGDIEDTEYVIPKRRESNVAIMDMMLNALDLTLTHTNKIYVLYDDFGKLMLKNIENMGVDILIDAETAENFSYESSIDKDTYNLIKLVVDDKQRGIHAEYYAPRDNQEFLKSESLKKWGVLQYFENTNGKTENPQEKADKLLEYYNRVKRTLSIQNAIGDTRIRAGTMLYVDLNLGDMQLCKRVIVESIKHKFSNNQHVMDLTLRGDVITG
jgi:hypothetical protein